MKKLFFIVVFFFLFISGCHDINKETINSSNETKKMTDEEKIWDDAKKDGIYMYNIAIYDSPGEYAHKNGVDPNGEEFWRFSEDIKVLNRFKDNNAFAKEFLRLLENTNIVEIIENGSDLEKYLLISYLCIETNHHEGLGYNLDWILDEKVVDYNYELTNVWYKKSEFDSKNKLVANKYSSYNADFIFEFNNDIELTIIKAHGYISSYSSDISLNTEYKNVQEAKGNEKWTKLDKKVLDKVIVNNKEFLDFYIKYRNDVYYARFDKENNITGAPHAVKWEKEPTKSPSIGMTTDEVRSSTWGSPKKINKDTYAWGTTEQWVYDNGYIYFRNGFVTSISER